MKIGPKFKICKRLGPGVFEKCQTRAFTLAEARVQKKRRRGGARSDFALQQLEKQKMRLTYGLSEKQFSRYVKEAVARKGTSAVEQLITSLESRLDNVVYRLGLAQTRRQARQLVSHGHITVNERKVTIPSYCVLTGDLVSIRERSKTSPFFAARTEEKSSIPTWLSFDVGKKAGSVLASPFMDTAELFFDPAAVVEFYSR